MLIATLSVAPRPEPEGVLRVVVRSQPNTYALRRRSLANLRPNRSAGAEPPARPSPAAAAITGETERRRRNFEQRRLEHLRERWRSRMG
jgi:hypothetical protein